jgi:hypothetical protein
VALVVLEQTEPAVQVHHLMQQPPTAGHWALSVMLLNLSAGKAVLVVLVVALVVLEQFLAVRLAAQVALTAQMEPVQQMMAQKAWAALVQAYRDHLAAAVVLVVLILKTQMGLAQQEVPSHLS